MQLIYTHGFNSGPSSSSGRKLRQTFPDMPLTVLSYDSALDFPAIYAQLKGEAQKIKAKGPTAMVGSSLGGYYTALLSSDLGLPCVLVNPCNNPPLALKEFVGKNVSFEDEHPWVFTKKALESYKSLDAAKLAPVPRLVIVGRNDILLDPLDNAAFWNGYAKVAMTDDEHSIASFEPLKKQILEIFNS